MKIAICDDQNEYIKSLQAIIKSEIEEKIDESIEIKPFSNGHILIQEYIHSPFDVVFLDVNMPQMDGRELASCLRRMSDDVILIFVSQYDEYVFNSFDVAPLGFIRKSQLKEMTEEICPKIIKKYKDNNFSIELNNDRCKVQLRPAKIWYFECDGRYLNIYYRDGMKGRIKYPIKKMAALLEDHGFIRIHKSFLANYRYMYRITGYDVLLCDFETKLPVTKNRLKEIKTTYFDWLGGRR